MSNNLTSKCFQVFTTEIVHNVVFWSQRHIGPNSLNFKNGGNKILQKVGVSLQLNITSKP
jgi:hypothetical protein